MIKWFKSLDKVEKIAFGLSMIWFISLFIVILIKSSWFGYLFIPGGILYISYCNSRSNYYERKRKEREQFKEKLIDEFLESEEGKRGFEEFKKFVNDKVGD